VDSTSASRGFMSDALSSSSRSKLDIVGDGASTLVSTADEVDLAGEVDIVGEEAREGSRFAMSRNACDSGEVIAFVRV